MALGYPLKVTHYSDSEMKSIKMTVIADDSMAAMHDDVTTKG
jgi:hypothetical protein